MAGVTRTFGVDRSRVESLLLPGDEFVAYTENMVVENFSKTKSRQVDITQDEDGEYIPGSAVEFGKREEWQINFKAKGSATIPALTLDNPGEVDRFAVTGITVNTAKGAKATVSVTGHIHVKNDGSTEVIHDTRERSATTIPSFAGFGASTFGLSMGVDAASLQSGTYTLEFLHTDEDAADGGPLCGITHGVKHTATFEAVEDTAWAVPQGWTEETQAENQSNTAYRRRTITIAKYEASPVDHSGD